MSPCTKRLQRSTRSLAPFSGLSARVWAWTAGANTAPPAPTLAAAATPAELSRNLRRLNSVMGSLLRWTFAGSRGKEIGSVPAARSGRQALAAAGVEQVRARQVGREVDRAARREVVALAEHGRDVDALVAAGDEGVHAGR